MLRLREDKALIQPQRREIRRLGVEHIRDAKRLQGILQVEIGGHVKLRQAQRNLRILRLRPAAVRHEEAQRLVGLEQILRRFPVVRPQQPHRPAAVHRKTDRREAVAVVDVPVLAAVHKLARHVAARRVERVLRRGRRVKFVRPARAVVDRRGQRQHGLRIKAQPRRLLGQQVASIFVDPAAQRLVVRLRTHVAGIGRREIVGREAIHRRLIIFRSIPQPERVGQQARHAPIVPAVFEPEGLGPRAERLDVVLAERVQNLRPALAVGTLGQHRERHIDIQRRADAVFSIASREERGHHRQKPLRKAIHRGVHVLRSGLIVRVPRLIGRGPRLIVPFTGLLVVVIHLLRILRHLRDDRHGQLCRQKGARLLVREGHIAARRLRRAAHHGHCRRHGQSKCKNLFHVPCLLLSGLPL